MKEDLCKITRGDRDRNSGMSERNKLPSSKKDGEGGLERSHVPKHTVGVLLRVITCFVVAPIAGVDDVAA